ncbi:uncharacterized protein LOC113525652 isoform X2 [Pangasianodon hypophthalmus]|uniref:uncharacterized protein LOC113525652 isoform X2 n=1 Tax=Pangasianodon hypophthalmus TaxID=310915 RepID=UPI0023080187|nr:uncharacterized protein LOC113525652 isoform X2 [Pangasianodon hypophthalmus]
MKNCFSTSFILLAVSVLGVMLNDDVYETGSEGNAAVILCPYTARYKTYPKYFCKGIYKDCKTLIKTDGQKAWMFEGVLSLYDNTEKKMFVVTMNNLSIRDAGPYGCGVEITGQDPFTVVHLNVMKAQKQHLPTLLTTISTSPNKGRAAARPTQPTKLQSLSGTTWPNSTENMKDVCLYDEIQCSNPAEENASETPDVMPSPNPYPACKTIYTTVTNQKQEPYLINTLPTNHVSCSPRLHSDLTENLREPKYCHVEFPDAGDFNHSMEYSDTYSTVQGVVDNQSPIYSVIIAPKTDSNSDYTNVVPPKQDTHDERTST